MRDKEKMQQIATGKLMKLQRIHNKQMKLRGNPSRSKDMITGTIFWSNQLIRCLNLRFKIKSMNVILLFIFIHISTCTIIIPIANTSRATNKTNFDEDPVPYNVTKFASVSIESNDTDGLDEFMTDCEAFLSSSIESLIKLTYNLNFEWLEDLNCHGSVECHSEEKDEINIGSTNRSRIMKRVHRNKRDTSDDVEMIENDIIEQPRAERVHRENSIESTTRKPVKIVKSVNPMLNLTHMRLVHEDHRTSQNDFNDDQDNMTNDTVPTKDPRYAERNSRRQFVTASPSGLIEPDSGGDVSVEGKNLFESPVLKIINEDNQLEHDTDTSNGQSDKLILRKHRGSTKSSRKRSNNPATDHNPTAPSISLSTQVPPPEQDPVKIKNQETFDNIADVYSNQPDHFSIPRVGDQQVLENSGDKKGELVDLLNDYVVPTSSYMSSHHRISAPYSVPNMNSFQNIGQASSSDTIQNMNHNKFIPIEQMQYPWNKFTQHHTRQKSIPDLNSYIEENFYASGKNMKHNKRTLDSNNNWMGPNKLKVSGSRPFPSRAPLTYTPRTALSTQHPNSRYDSYQDMQVGGQSSSPYSGAQNQVLGLIKAGPVSIGSSMSNQQVYRRPLTNYNQYGIVSPYRRSTMPTYIPFTGYSSIPYSSTSSRYNRSYQRQPQTILSSPHRIGRIANSDEHSIQAAASSPATSDPMWSDTQNNEDEYQQSPQTIQITAVPNGLGGVGWNGVNGFNGFNGLNGFNGWGGPWNGRQVLLVNRQPQVGSEWRQWILPVLAVLALPLVLGALFVPLFLKTVMFLIQILQMLGLLMPPGQLAGHLLTNSPHTPVTG